MVKRCEMINRMDTILQQRSAMLSCLYAGYQVKDQFQLQVYSCVLNVCTVDPSLVVYKVFGRSSTHVFVQAALTSYYAHSFYHTTCTEACGFFAPITSQGLSNVVRKWVDWPWELTKKSWIIAMAWFGRERLRVIVAESVGAAYVAKDPFREDY